jgi:hypothetical protein
MRSPSWRREPPAAREKGVALIVTLMVLMLVSALMVGFVTAIAADQRAAGLDRDQTQAYAAAHAGLEQLTADLTGLFGADFSPDAQQIATLTATPPDLGERFTFVEPGGASGYRIGFTPDADGNPAPEAATGTTISAGPYQGMRGIITPYNITVTARTRGGAEVRMRRTLQTVAMPVFQFAQFSEQALAFQAENDFEFGGRVHTNSNLYLAQFGNTSSRLTLPDRITAVGEIIRTHLMNGFDGSTDYRGTVRVIKNAPNNFRNLARTEGSLVTNDFGVLNEPLWTSLSVGTYASNIRNGRTGARRLDLPLVAQGGAPIDLVRRPGLNAPVDFIFGQRLFAQASIRILLSDAPEQITGLATVTPQAPVPLDGTPVAGYVPGGTVAPLAASGGGGEYTSPAGTPLLGGYIKIEQRTGPDVDDWQDVTLQILNYGISGRNLSTGVPNIVPPPATQCAEPQPNAIVRLQRVKDLPTSGGPHCGLGISQVASDYWPNVLYDTREGNVRDNLSTALTDLRRGGIMHYVELDVSNLKRWIEGHAAYPGGTGPQTWGDNGYVLYFSDRRLNHNGASDTGEYGFEDVVNPADANGAPNGGTPDAGEDINGNGTLEVYGGTSASPVSTVPTALQARANAQVLFRRALKVVNGSLGNLPSPGFTVASENPVYVQGNYNATATNTEAEPNMACAIIADAVTLLSNSWNDIRSFVVPNNAVSRAATTTGYRMGIIAGKSLAFPRPTAWSSPRDFGTDGGVHDFLRILEGWGNETLNYRGSLVSFYTSRQAVGTYKSGLTNANVFRLTNRSFTFDTDFLVPTQLPPGTPAFRDVNTLTFRQLLRPTQ